MDSAGGADLDPDKVARHFQKNQKKWGDDGPPGYDYSRGNGNPKNYSGDPKNQLDTFKTGLT